MSNNTASPPPAPVQPEPVASIDPYASDSILCYAWGETDHACAAIVTTRDQVRQFLVAQWFGDSDDPGLPEAMARFDSGPDDEWDGTDTLEWTFEIGGVRLTKIYHVASPPPAQPAQAEPVAEWRKALRAAEISHTGMSYGDEKRGDITEYTRGWGDCLASFKKAFVERGKDVLREAASPAQPAQAEPTAEMVRAYLDANDAYWRRVDELPSKIGVWRDGTPQEATLHSLRAAIAAQPKREPLTFVVRSVDAGFRWDSVAQCHIPQLVVEFDPVPTNGPSDAAGWQARDACAAMLSERLTLGEQG